MSVFQAPPVPVSEAPVRPQFAAYAGQQQQPSGQSNGGPAPPSGPGPSGPVVTTQHMQLPAQVVPTMAQPVLPKPVAKITTVTATTRIVHPEDDISLVCPRFVIMDFLRVCISLLVCFIV